MDKTRRTHFAAQKTSNTELKALFRRVNLGDLIAWGELYRRYSPSVFRFCRRTLQSHEDAEDATTEIFMKVRENMGTFDSSRPFLSWLYKIASNHCCDKLRRRHGHLYIDMPQSDLLKLHHCGHTQHERLETLYTRRTIQTGLDMLGNRARLTLFLRYYSGFTCDEIADSFRCTGRSRQSNTPPRGISCVSY
jgi:RNA polymerase sigma-70 factor (ECF subfamily)